jgi:hypothetical protein
MKQLFGLFLFLCLPFGLFSQQFHWLKDSVFKESFNSILKFNNPYSVCSIDSVKIEKDTLYFINYNAAKTYIKNRNSAKFHLTIDSNQTIHLIQAINEQQYNNKSRFYYRTLQIDKNHIEIQIEKREGNNLNCVKIDSVVTTQGFANSYGPFYNEKWVYKPIDSIRHSVQLEHYSEKSKSSRFEYFTFCYEPVNWSDFETLIKRNGILNSEHENTSSCSHSKGRKVIVYFNSGNSLEVQYNDCTIISEIPPEILSLFPNSYLENERK